LLRVTGETNHSFHASDRHRDVVWLPSVTVTLGFHSGTIELRGVSNTTVDAANEASFRVPSCLAWDERSACYRAPAVHYARVVLALRASRIAFEDRARNYDELASGLSIHREPRPYQREALEAWRQHSRRGVVVLPTGAGKTHVAIMAIDSVRRSTLVIAPTLDLVRQWYDILRVSFSGQARIGIVGGGEHTIEPLTVATYDSAYLHMEHLGAKFGLVIFDECHHLPSPSYAFAAQCCIAPFRLGLTATPERTDGREADLHALVGPTVYRRDIREFAGEYLADYNTVRVDIEFTTEERAEYESERATYRDFLFAHRIDMSGPRGFQNFIIRASQSAEGRQAIRAYRRQRELAFAASGKLAFVEHLFDKHKFDRVIVFTQDNATAYLIARQFLIPVITHQTRVSERSEILEGFAAHRYGAIVTSKVLNEGVDIQDANVAVILSGSGSVREHVQRLGRILRKREGKQATLYELVTMHTTETTISDRRREHNAYR